MEWLHEGCDSDLSADFLHFGASDFPSKNPFKKCFKIVFFSLWRRDPVLELQFPMPLRVVLLCFCNSVSADRIGMAASRSFEGSLARNACLALVISLPKILLKSASKSSFFRSGVEIRFWSYNFRRRCA